jgi:hypothetical protein
MKITDRVKGGDEFNSTIEMQSQKSPENQVPAAVQSNSIKNGRKSGKMRFL